MDEIIVFHQLSREHLVKILDLQMEEISRRLAERTVKLEVTGPAKEFLVSEKYDFKMGARPLRRHLERGLEDPLAEMILRGKLPSGSRVRVGLKNRQLNFTVSQPRPAKRK